MGRALGSGRYNINGRNAAGWSRWRSMKIAQNQRRQMKDIIDGIMASVQKGMSLSMGQLAPLILQAAVRQAGFSDYTGVLVNSYAAAMFVNGKFAGNMKGIKLPGSWNGNPQAIWTSYRMPGVIRIQKGRDYKRIKRMNALGRSVYKTINGTYRENGYFHYRRGYGSGDRMLMHKRTYRNPKSTEFMPFDAKSFNPQGWAHNGTGRGMTILKSMKGNLSRGTEIILKNVAPYADDVNFNTKGNHAGSNVLPEINGMKQQAISIVRKQLELAIREFNNVGKKGRKFF